MNRSIELTPDCSSCAALCCVVFAFDKSESFAIDKQAGEVCPNLDGTLRCRIFDQRQSLGFGGCIAYDCYGAGQRVTQEVFKGIGWQDNPSLKERMGAALSVLRRIHELLLLVKSAKAFPLSSEEEHGLAELEEALNPVEDWTEKSLREFPIDAITRESGEFLRFLRHHVASSATAHI